MRKVYAYLLGGVLVLGSLIITQSCNRDTSSTTTTLIGNWSKSSDFDGNARGEAVSFVIGDFAYISTGTTDRDRFKDLWEYSIARQFWSQKADFPGVARNSAVAFSIGTKGYVGTGFDGANNLKDFWEYNQATNAWTQRANFGGSARYDAVAFAANSKGYISCGFDGNYLKDLWLYDPTTDTWTQKASIGGTKRSAAQTFTINGKVYIISGNNNGTALTDLWMYDPTVDTWTPKRNIINTNTAADSTYDDLYTTIARFNGVAFTMNNLGYISTGTTASIIANTWEYDPTADQWTEKTGFEGSPRQGAVAFTLGTRAFLITGMNGSLSFDNCYEFHPNDAVNTSDN